MNGLAYAPALDGLRALCLLAVLCFHSDFAWMSGGFLGVSTFFTLSGFLITALLVAEYDRESSISPAVFWSRRLRRLTPAAFLTVAAVVVSAPLWLPLAQQERLAADAIAAVTWLVNWRFVQAEYAYELIFTDPSPLQHFWSLAIEAQFYLFFPLLVAAVLRAGLSRRGLSFVVIVFLGLSVLLSFVPGIAEEGQYRIYYGSDTRAAEILVGSLGAIWFLGRQGKPAEEISGLLRWIALPALAALVVAWHYTQVDDSWLYRGGFLAYAMVSVVVVVAAMVSTPLQRLLSINWLVWLGRVSYGAYLYHWPVFLILSESRTGLGAGVLFALRVGVTFALAGASARWIEEPIRRHRVLGDRAFLGSCVGGLFLIGSVAVAMSPLSLDQRMLALDIAVPETAGQLAPQVPGAESRVEKRRLALFGDSMALSLVPGLQVFAKENPGFRLVRGDTSLGCGVVAEGEYHNHGHWWKAAAGCRDAPGRWGDSAIASRVDIAIVLSGAWESRDWRLSPEGSRLQLGDPLFDAMVAEQIASAMDSLVEKGATVLWLTVPHLGIPPGIQPSKRAAFRAPSEPERQDRLNQLIREVAGSRSEVQVIDLASAVEGWPGGEFDVSLRPDLTHFGGRGSVRIVRRFLGPAILEVER